LSPSALEINKRYFINEQGNELFNDAGETALLDYAISMMRLVLHNCYACVQFACRQ
jgi:hypothetical protein